jgi:2,3-bisphosphoglycerate-dependent phosphoglycerate mutase
VSQHLWLVRHGQTGWNAEARYLGASDADLDEAGLEQARQLARWAAGMGIGAILTSPARRAWRTASTVGSQLGIQPRVDDRLRELDFGLAEGCTMDELRQENPRAVARFELDPVLYHFADGEDPRDAVGRVRAAVVDVLQFQDARTLMVTHNTVLRLLLCDVLNVALAQYRRVLPIVEHCAITELSVSDGILALRRFNAPAVP